MATVIAKIINPNASSTENYVGGSLPSAGDDLVFAADFPHIEITSGFDALASIELDSVTIEAGAVVDMTDHLQIDVSGSGGAGLVVYGSGSLKFEAVDAGGAGDGGVPDAQIYCDRNNGRVQLKGAAGQSSDGWDVISIGGVSDVLIEGTPKPAVVVVSDSARVEIDKNATAITTLEALGNATVDSNRGITTATVNGDAQLLQDEEDVATLIMRGNPARASGARWNVVYSAGAEIGTTASQLWSGGIRPGTPRNNGHGKPALSNISTRGTKRTMMIASSYGNVEATVGTPTRLYGQTITASDMDAAPGAGV